MRKKKKEKAICIKSNQQAEEAGLIVWFPDGVSRDGIEQVLKLKTNIFFLIISMKNNQNSVGTRRDQSSHVFTIPEWHYPFLRIISVKHLSLP